MARSNKKRLHDMTPPERLVREIEQLYPQAWQYVDIFRADPPKPWPDWCYITISETTAIVTNGADEDAARDMLLGDRLGHPAMMAATAAWRITKGIYRFDADLVDALMDQPLDGVIPVDVLYHLPEWCVYIELPQGDKVVGFFAHLECDVHTGIPELRFVFCDGGQYTLTPLILKDTLAASAEAFTASVAERAKRPVGVVTADDICWIVPYLQLVLYLCATNADMPPISPPATRRGKVLPFPGPRVWDVGLRVGAALRKAREQAVDRPSEASGDGRLPPRPHVRRAHYHHYWVGEGRGELAVRWIAPTLIGAQEDGPVVVRGVE